MPGLDALPTVYIPVHGTNSPHSTLSKQQTTVISLQSFQVASAKTIEDIIEQLPPISVKRYEEHRTIFTYVSSWWLQKQLLGFGIETKNDIKYSDLEKTVVEFVYLWRYSG